MSTPAGVTFEAVVCRYGRRVAVDGVDLDVAAGEHVALTGANGSGKTTLLRAALGLHPIAGGADHGRRRRRRRSAVGAAAPRVAWMPQRLAPGRFPLLVGELLDSGGDPEAAAGAADGSGSAGCADRPLHTLSGGQLQRVFLARRSARSRPAPRVLFADEPTAALDFAGQEQVAAGCWPHCRSPSSWSRTTGP